MTKEQIKNRIEQLNQIIHSLILSDDQGSNMSAKWCVCVKERSDLQDKLNNL